MPTRAQVCAWIAGFGLVVPSLAMAQDRTDRTEREVVDLIVRDGPQASAIRAETEVTRREQLARLWSPNPGVMCRPGGCGLHGVSAGRAIAAGVRHARRALSSRSGRHRCRGSRTGRAAVDAASGRCESRRKASGRAGTTRGGPGTYA